MALPDSPFAALAREPRVVSNVKADVLLSATELESLGSRFFLASTDDLLGLSMDGRVKEAALSAIRRLGVRPPRDNRVREELEGRLAALLGTEAVTVCSERTVVSALPGRLIAEMRTRARLDLPTAETFFTPESLEALLAFVGSAPPTIITDAVHRFDGELAPLPRMAELATRTEATLVVVDGAGLGVLGATGGGALEHAGLRTQVELEVLSLSGAVAGAGWAVAGRRATLDAVRGFTAEAPPVGALASCAKALELAAAEPQRRARVLSLCGTLLDGLRNRGFDTGPCVTPWVPVWLGDEALGEQWLRALAELGIACRAWLAGSRSRLLLSLSATTTDAQLATLLEAFDKVAKKLGLPSPLSTEERGSVHIAAPGSFVFSTTARAHWIPLETNEFPEDTAGVEQPKDAARTMSSRVLDAVETLTWRAANLRGARLPGSAALRALLDRARRR